MKWLNWSGSRLGVCVAGDKRLNESKESGNRLGGCVDLAPDAAIEVALWKVKIDWRSSPAALPRETWTLFGDDLQPVVFTRQPGEIKTSVLPVIKSAP